jgi:hypothetical protein
MKPKGNLGLKPNMLKSKFPQLHKAVARQQQKLQQVPKSRNPQQLVRSLMATLLKDFLAVELPEIYGAATSSDLTGIANFLIGQGQKAEVVKGGLSTQPCAEFSLKFLKHGLPPSIRY